MMPLRQRTDEWIEGCDWPLHERQFENPYRITERFCEWLTGYGCFAPSDRSRFADVGAGMGANIYFIASRHPDAEFVGFDINPECVRRGNKKFAKLSAGNCRLEVADL